MGDTEATSSRGWSALKDSPRPLRTFLVGNAVSDLGNGFFRLALPWLVYDLTGSAAAMGVLAALQYAPSLMVPWFGRIVDRYSVRRILLTALGVESAAITGLAILLSVHRLTLFMVDAGAMVATTGNLVAWTATQVVVQRMTPAPSRIAVNTFTATLFNLSWYVSPALAGLVIGHWGIAAALFANGIALWVAVVAALPLPPLLGSPITAHTLWRAWGALRQATSAATVTLVFGFWNFTWGGVYALQVFFFRHDLHLSPATVGLVGLLAGAAPTLLAGLGPRLVDRLSVLALMMGTLAVSGIGMLGLAASRSWWEATLAVGAIDSAFAPVTVVMTTLTQSAIATEFYGQVSGWQMLVSGIGVPVAGLAAGMVAASIGAPATMAAAGALTLVGSLGLPATPLRRARVPQARPPVEEEAGPPPGR